MMLNRVRALTLSMLLALASAAVLGCGRGGSAGGGSTSTTVAATPEAPDPGSPFACSRDADCPRLACGPCERGAVVSRYPTRVSCYRNPCPGAVAVCRGGVCVVQ